MIRGLRVSLVAVFLVLSCSKERKPENSATTPGAVGSVAASSIAPKATASAARRVEPLTEESVRDLVDRWAKAQSSADFAGYEGLYAERFTGVKRAGRYVATYGRKVWMADRKTMILPGLVVEANAVKVSLAAGGARVLFLQHYKSPKFEDVGPKQLVVVQTPAGPKIAREEMLASQVTGAKQDAGAGRSAEVYAAESSGAFLTADFPTGAARGQPESVKLERISVPAARMAADESLLGDAVKKWKGRVLTAFDGTGKPCLGRIQRFSIRAAATPHFGMVNELNETHGSEAKMIWELTEGGGRYLFGQFEAPCPGAIFATEKSGLTVVPFSPTDGAVHDAALAAFRRTEGYRKLQAEYRSDKTNTGNWEEAGSTPSFVLARLPNGKRRLVVSGRGGRGCADFWGTLTEVFDVARDPPAAPVRLGAIEGSDDQIAVVAAFDLNGDGEPEFLTGPDGVNQTISLVRRDGNAFEREDVFTAPYFDCPC